MQKITLSKYISNIEYFIKVFLNLVNYLRLLNKIFLYSFLIFNVNAHYIFQRKTQLHI